MIFDRASTLKCFFNLSIHLLIGKLRITDEDMTELITFGRSVIFYYTVQSGGL